MPSKNQETVTNTAASPDALGRAKALFGTSPILSEELSPAERKAFYLDLLNSTVQNGYGFSEGVSLNYVDAPDMTAIPEGAASPFLPNPTSPGEGNGANPAAKPAAPEAFANATANPGTFPGGPTVTPGEVSPADTTAKINKSGFDGLVLGQSRFSSGG